MDAQAALILLFLMPSLPGALFSGSFLIILSSLFGLSILSMILMSSAELWASSALAVVEGSSVFLKCSSASTVRVSAESSVKLPSVFWRTFSSSQGFLFCFVILAMSENNRWSER